MQGINTIIRQNREALVRNAREEFVGKTVRAENRNGEIVQGVVSHVNYNGDRVEYFLAGKVGPFFAPTLVTTQAA